ncbi:MAG TPA: ATP-binding protein [Alphaproteobacteria bacterium]
MADGPRGDSGYDELTHNMILPVVAMAAIGLVIIVFVIFLAARWQDIDAAGRSFQVASSAFNFAHRDLSNTAADYARRPDTLRHLVLEPDPDWADLNVGEPVSETHGYDWILVIGGDGSASYAWGPGGARSFAAARDGSPALERLVTLARAERARPLRPMTGLAMVAGTPHVAAAVPLISDAGAAPPAVLVFARAIDEAFLDQLSRASGLSKVRLLSAAGPADEDSIPLVAADGTPLGAVAWVVDQSGQEVFTKSLVLIALAGPAMIVLGWAFVRRARDTVYMLIRQERALQEERARAQEYLAVVRAVVVALDPDGRVQMINDLGRRMLGRDHSELVGRRWVALAVPEDRRAEVTGLFERMLAGADDAPATIEYEILTRDGARRLVSWQHAAIRDQHGAVIGILASGDDVTDRRRMEQRVREQEAELAHFLRLGTLGEMATGLAHELNQPLAAIKNFAQGCVRRMRAGNADPAELLKAIEQVNAQATRAGEIIRRMRSFVRKREPVRAPMDVNQAIREVAELIARDVKRLGVSLELALDEHLPPALADMIQVEQVILNLARNGLDVIALEPASARRRLTIRSGPGEQGSVMVSVSDTGRGIAPDQVENLFEPFYTTKKEGLGMGLSISRSIIEAHHGRLWAEPNPDGGSVFRFTLPAASMSKAA